MNRKRFALNVTVKINFILVQINIILISLLHYHKCSSPVSIHSDLTWRQRIRS